MPTPSIVTINVSVTTAPTPLTLQSTGALVSQGGTNLSANSYALLTSASSYTALLPAALGISSISWSGGTAVVTTSAAIPGLTTGDVFLTTIAGVSPAGYNGLVKGTVTGANTFTYALATNPGAVTVQGTYTPPGQGELQAMVNTFFTQGSSQAVYVLELGAGDATNGPAALGTWITANPGVFYSYLIPGFWDASAGLLALLAQYEAPNSKTYFFITTNSTNYSAYSATQKCGIVTLATPSTLGRPLTEFSAAALFQHSLSYAPSTSNRMTPFAYAFLFGVTPYPTVGNGSFLTSVLAANVNYIATGAEGGISTAIVYGGTTLDGNDFTWWYSADWIQLQSDQAIANAVINGSNNPLNPLYYNQLGINFLQDVVVQTVQNAISFGLANGTVARTALDGPVFAQNYDDGDYVNQDVVNAVPFITYLTENPGNYKIGLYGGLSLVYIPNRGFKQIIFNINVTQLVAP